MKHLLVVLLLTTSAFAQTADQASRALAERGDLDEIRWVDPSKGQTFRAGVVRATSEGLEVQRGVVKRVLAYDQIGGVKFGMTMGERQLIAQAKAEAAPALRVFWEARQRTLTIQGSNVGEFGLALARSLSKTKAVDEALLIANQVMLDDNDPLRRVRAKAECDTLIFMQAMAQEKPEEIEKRARAITEEGDASNPDLMLLVTGFLMTKEFEALKKIEADNPRWMEDEEIKPERDRHYHQALDLALYPSLFQPMREAEAADGLWQAAQVYLHTRESERAVQTLEDLLALYADSTHTGKAREILATLKPASATAATPNQTSDKTGMKVANNEPMGPPPPPKRYNLFED